MLELLWLEDEVEARSEQTRVTKLWERFSTVGQNASPFGVILRPAPGTDPVCPWRSWNYRPQTMSGLELEIAADTGLTEPMWCYTKSGRAPAEWPPERLQPLDHPTGFREITRVLIGCPEAKEGSVTNTMSRHGVIALQTEVEHLLELQFDGGCRAMTLDFRPALPLIFRVGSISSLSAFSDWVEEWARSPCRGRPVHIRNPAPDRLRHARHFHHRPAQTDRDVR
jgi:hypothetical protein